MAATTPALNVIVLIAATVYGLGMALFRVRRLPRETARADTGPTAPSVTR